MLLSHVLSGVDLVFSAEKNKVVYLLLLLIFVLTMSFLMLGSFSKTMQMLLESASLLNLSALLPIFAMQFFFNKSIGFLSLCIYPGKTKQIFLFLFSSASSEKT